MYAKYNYTNAATIGNVIADVVAILTGETTVANLSAGADDANCSIATTYAVAGWTLHDQTANSMSTVTISNASPGVVTKTAHGLANDEPVSFTTTGGLPTGLSVNTTYYVRNQAANTFEVSATIGGASINTSSAGSGTHTGWSGRKQVLKAAVADDAAFYKYAMIDCVTATFMQMHLYESWNATTHAGTNLATALGTTYQQRLTVGTGATMAIAASARFIAMQSTTAAGIGCSASNSWTGVFERSRLAPWDTTANAYTPALLAGGAAFGQSIDTFGAMQGASTCRYKNPAGGDFTGANAGVFPVMMGWNGMSANNGGYTCGCGSYVGTTGTSALSGSIKTKVPDGAGGFYTPFNEIQFRNPVNSFEGGSISAACDVWNTVSYPNNLDECTKGANTYIIWQNTLYATSTTPVSAAYQNSANTIFPKG